MRILYYPLSSDTHSSAGIPSLLNSPLSVMTPSSGNNSAAAAAAAGIPFKFRPRRESVDWRRINAVDVDLVVSQLDVDALQEHVGTVTFCSLEGERCPRCQGPVDPALVKLLRLAQLTVEWLLHCQEFLALNLRAAEERLAAAGRERDELLERQRGQEEKAKALMAELKQRKKVIRTQQSLLAPRIISHKCLHCEKTFMNSSFLQNHVQRRHPDEFDARKPAGRICSQQSMHKDLLRELDRFKAEEMARMDRKIEDSRDGMRKEMEFLYSRNIQALNVLNSTNTLFIYLGEISLPNWPKATRRRAAIPPPGVRSKVTVWRASTSLRLVKIFLLFLRSVLPPCVSVLQIRPRSSSLPSRPAAKQPKTPQPAPRTKTASTPPKTSTPNTAALRIPAKTPPFSSDEESEDRPASRQVRGSRGGPRQAAVSRKQSDDDDGWSDVSELQEIDPQQLGRYRDQNGNLERRNPGKGQHSIQIVTSALLKMEKQFAERVLKKPAGGVSILPEKKDEVQELTYTDLEESSDWVVSSLEDKPGPLRKSLDSPSTSVWGTSTGKAPRSGLTEAGTGSTLKSSLCSLSDISDSDDASNRPGKY
uniref:Zinc finger protein Dzip1-like n=1 Tax=Salarias fasciatus TaxID=181472 RepID=A0A672HXY4_SALFA